MGIHVSSFPLLTSIDLVVCLRHVLVPTIRDGLLLSLLNTKNYKETNEVLFVPGRKSDSG